MLFLPYSGALDLAKKPLVSYAVIIICIVLHQFQWDNRTAIEHEAESYCLSVKEKGVNLAGIDVFKNNYLTCKRNLMRLHESRDFYKNADTLSEKIRKQYDYSEIEKKQIALNIKKHYELFKESAPNSLDKQLMYYPDDTNLWKMLTATISHDDWLHVMSNLLFFFAFATGVEGVINNRYKYFFSLLALTFITSVSYSIFSSSSSESIPTLGLSGVVMGMIGMAAYIMPNARIKVLIWGFRFVRTYYMRVWVLAGIYIGWDTLMLYAFGQRGGVNLIFHVSGGFAGFFIALFFFKDRKLAAKEELDDEIDYQVSRKKDFHSYDLSSTYGQDKVVDRLHVRQSKKEYEDYMQKIYGLVNVHKDAEAVLLIMKDYTRYEHDYKLLQQVFERVFDWGKSATLLCIGRMLIDIMITAGRHAEAVGAVKQCQSVSKGFILSDPSIVPLLVRYAIELKEYEVAYNLVHDAVTRFHKSVDIIPMQLCEADLCIQYLAKHDKAKEILKSLLASEASKYKSEIMNLAKSMQ